MTVLRHWSDGAGDVTLEHLEQVLPTVEVKRMRRLDPVSATGDAPWEIFASRYSITDVLSHDPLHQWEDVGTRGGMPAWRYVGSSSDYSIKQSDTGAVIVWSGTIADELGVEPGAGVDLWRLACSFAGVDPTQAAKGAV